MESGEVASPADQRIPDLESRKLPERLWQSVDIPRVEKNNEDQRVSEFAWQILLSVHTFNTP
jgi:hypothetical protein